MGRCKNKAARLFHITVWSIITILCIYVMIQCIIIFGMESEDTEQSDLKPESSTVSIILNNMIQSGIPIYNYLNNQDNNDVHSSIILNTMLNGFPINQYIADIDIDTNNQNVDANEDTQYANGDDSSSDDDVDDDDADDTLSTDVVGSIPIDFIPSEIFLEQGDGESDSTNSNLNIDVKETMGNLTSETFTVEQLINRPFLYQNFYIIDKSTKVDDKIFDAKEMLAKDMTLKQNPDLPQILIYHTHSRETFIDSKEGKESDTIVGVGSYLADILAEDYGYQVIHDKTHYDVIDGKIDRNLAYNNAEPAIEKIVKENPSIEVIIDLHRDGVEGTDKRVVTIDGKETARLMFFNGLSTNSKGEEISYLSNPNQQNNLAFSLQLQLKGREIYPGLMFKNYLKAYRYNLHIRPRSALIEIGTQNNTIEEAKNAMELLADVLDEVLTGEE